MEKRIFNSKNQSDVELQYLYHAPKADEKLPLFIYVHGAGSRGSDLDLLRDNAGLKAALQSIGDKAVVIAPQCHKNYWFDLFIALEELIDTYRHADNVDINRVYVCGSSMGGYTTWQLLLSNPTWFTAALPICGGGMYWAAESLKDIPIWAFHGALDDVVLPEETLHLVNRINGSGGKARITIFPNTYHDSWIPALESKETWEWLLGQTK